MPALSLWYLVIGVLQMLEMILQAMPNTATVAQLEYGDVACV